MSVSYASSRCCSQLLKVAHRTPLLLYFFSHVRSSALSPQHLVLDFIVYMIFFIVPGICSTITVLNSLSRSEPR